MDNPVDWFPWGDAAFAKARSEDKPILLSIGYSACHWCHVMAHESFEDEETAAQMNHEFVCIKVDREEHPDVDQVYQHALNLFDEHGGWPLTMFLLPSGEPFYGGTYFPNRDAYGRPSFRRVMSALSSAYQTQRKDVAEQAQKLVTALQQLESRGAGAETAEQLPPDFVQRVASRLETRIDRRLGGFAGAPKFPNPSSLSIFLRAFAKKREEGTASPTLLTLSNMGEGGIYDHLGGGFARYSTDEKWLVPHFEKMLYDNAQLLRLYAESNRIAFELSLPVADRYAQIIAETHGWLEREMRDPSGGLYAAQDADSEGVEGKYFVWSPDEVAAVLDAEHAELFCRTYDIIPGGNWNDPHGHGPRGKSIPHLAFAPQDAESQQRLAEARAKLLAARHERVPPSTDDKILCGWNGLAITGLAEAGRLLGEARYVQAAKRTADFALDKLRDENGRLLRTYKGGTAKLPATLDDHAFLAEGLYHLAHATQDFSYFDRLRELMDALLFGFYDAERRLFFLGPDESAGVRLCARPVSLHDSAIPSGLSVACMNLLRLSALIDSKDAARERYQNIAEKTLRGLSEQALRNPFGLSNLVAAIDLLQSGLVVAVIVDPGLSLKGQPSDGGRALWSVTAARYVPDLFTIVCHPERPLAQSLDHLRAGKPAKDGKATAYVCRGPRCTAPITDEKELTNRLLET
jgi:uncharacterized protein YyaL (SSP411 family)